MLLSLHVLLIFASEAAVLAFDVEYFEMPHVRERTPSMKIQLAMWGEPVSL